MQVLLNAGADIDRPDCYGKTALYCAAREGQLAAVNCLLLQGGAVDCRTKDRETPLSAACRNGHVAVVAALLKAGANPRMAVDGQTPLYLAARGGHVELVDQLLAAGADPLERMGISRFFRSNSLDHMVRKKRDGATDTGERERYETIVQRLQQCSIGQRCRHRQADTAITEKTPLLS